MCKRGENVLIRPCNDIGLNFNHFLEPSIYADHKRVKLESESTWMGEMKTCAQAKKLKNLKLHNYGLWSKYIVGLGLRSKRIRKGGIITKPMPLRKKNETLEMKAHVIRIWSIMIIAIWYASYWEWMWIESYVGNVKIKNMTEDSSERQKLCQLVSRRIRILISLIPFRWVCVCVCLIVLTNQLPAT